MYIDSIEMSTHLEILQQQVVHSIISLYFSPTALLMHTKIETFLTIKFNNMKSFT